MEVNISDEMIERMVREQVKARINQYLAEQRNDNPYWIWDMCKDCVRYEVQKIVTREFVEDTCRELSKNNIAEMVVDRFAEKIANCFNY
jgi:REP element-mobilizing transposase RayT